MSKKICVIRIAGRVGLDKDIKETMKRLNLKRKYSCVLVEPTKESLGMINRIRDFVAFGEIDQETEKKLNEKRKTKIKNFYRLHPARGGIKTKIHYPKGVLGNHGDKIKELVEKML